MIGDTYLGRCLAGFNPDEPGFGMLPSHFKVGRDKRLKSYRSASNKRPRLQ
jgi:hypothetical protein